jgi:hypothetical protein
VPVGALRPWRHDNRRHLIVAHTPAEILGGHIPFTVRAVGTGPCYLESVLFLPECPAPSDWTPAIDRLSARVLCRDDDEVTAEMHLITAEAARVQVEAVPQGEGSGEVLRGGVEGPERLHAIHLTGLRPDARYRVEVAATERGGSRAEASLTLDAQSPPPTAETTVAVPLELHRLGGDDVAGMPLTFGLPIAQGRVTAPQGCVLRCGQERLAAQVRVHARWPDGSARWVLADVPCPEALGAVQSAEAKLVLNAGPAEGMEGLSWQVDDGRIVVQGPQVRVAVSRHGPLPARIEVRGQDGSWRTALEGERTCVTARLGNGLELGNGQPEGLALEEAGPQRTVIRYELPIVDPQGVAHLRSTVRLHVYAQVPFVRLVHRAVVTSPALGAAFGSADLSHLTDDLQHVRSAVVGSEGEATSLLDVESLELLLPWGAWDEGGPRRIVQEHDRAFRIESQAATSQEQGHWPGLLTLQSVQGPLALCIKHFWQLAPKGLRFGDGPLALEILPKLSDQPLPDYDELWHKLYFWYDPATARYKLKVGMAITTEMLIGCPEGEAQAASWQEWLEGGVAARPKIDYLNRTGALLPIAPKEGSPHPGYEAMMDGALDVWIDQLESRHEYGFLNYGDTYSDRECFWSNNEYDATLCQYLEFLRGGDPRWTLLGDATARHLCDVDTCNHSRQASQIGAQYMHTPGHAGGFLPPYYRSKSAGSHTIPSHSWVEGAVLHYLLTGDESVREVVTQTGLRLTRGLAYYDFRNARECGWHIIHLCGMARMGDDPRYLNAAAAIVARVLAAQQPGGGWEHPLAEAHCHCEPPRCHGEAGFMTGVLLSGLRRFHDLTRDGRVAEAMVGGARWLIDETYAPEVGLFRYTSCPNRSPPGRRPVQVIEGLANAYALSRDPRIGEVLRGSLADVGLSEDERTGLPRYGRDLSTEARYLPFALHVLEELGPAAG